MKEILLHSCCAPCSSAILEWMQQNDWQPTIFYSNSNIFPREEYEIRRNEIARYAEKLGVRFIEDEYDHEAWKQWVLRTLPDPPLKGGRIMESEESKEGKESKEGMESNERIEGEDGSTDMAKEPERGKRCLRCFQYRLKRAAEKAKELGLDELTTTLASSRWKSLEQINEAGKWACEQVPAENGEEKKVTFNERNWRKGGLQQRRNELLKQEGFYNQLYCGCEFSIRPTKDA